MSSARRTRRSSSLWRSRCLRRSPQQILRSDNVRILESGPNKRPPADEPEREWQPKHGFATQWANGMHCGVLLTSPSQPCCSALRCWLTRAAACSALRWRLIPRPLLRRPGFAVRLPCDAAARAPRDLGLAEGRHPRARGASRPQGLARGVPGALGGDAQPARGRAARQPRPALGGSGRARCPSVRRGRAYAHGRAPYVPARPRPAPRDSLS